MWGRHSVAEIAEVVNLWHKNNGKAKGYKMHPVTTERGVMFQALKLGFISQDELDEYDKQRKKTRAKKNYVPKSVRAAVLQRDGYKCLLCGATQDLTIDHIVSVDKGGSSDIDNLQTLCHHCDRVAKSMSSVDFRKPYVQEWCENCHRFHYKNVAA